MLKYCQCTVCLACVHFGCSVGIEEVIKLPTIEGGTL